MRFANGLGKLCGGKSLKRCQSFLKCCQSSLSPCPYFLTPCQNSLLPCHSFLSPSASSLTPCQSFLTPSACFLKCCPSSIKPCQSFASHGAYLLNFACPNTGRYSTKQKPSVICFNNEGFFRKCLLNCVSSFIYFLGLATFCKFYLRDLFVLRTCCSEY